jgi:hypothetical protein
MLLFKIKLPLLGSLTGYSSVYIQSRILSFDFFYFAKIDFYWTVAFVWRHGFDRATLKDWLNIKAWYSLAKYLTDVNALTVYGKIYFFFLSGNLSFSFYLNLREAQTRQTCIDNHRQRPIHWNWDRKKKFPGKWSFSFDSNLRGAQHNPFKSHLSSHPNEFDGVIQLFFRDKTMHQMSCQIYWLLIIIFFVEQIIVFSMYFMYSTCIYENIASHWAWAPFAMLKHIMYILLMGFYSNMQTY